MKEFVKMTLATIAGLFIFGFVALILMIAMVGAIASFGDSQPVMPREGVLPSRLRRLIRLHPCPENQASHL